MDTTISMLDFCRNIDAALARVEAGESLTLLRDGNPVLRLVPTNGQSMGGLADHEGGLREQDEDSFFHIPELAKEWIPKSGDESLTDRDMDRIVYDL